MVSRVLKYSIVALFIAGYAFSDEIGINKSVTNDTIRWTGAAGDNRWDNPENWDAGRVR